ncbi:uncharacterized protein EI97DRAFT_489156 [Westerdykella ornata]|uniref:Uncharacterized protein n=1 Tax=Westerdykella ornata TaxID=318751 RepID=A0A6A6JM76_WESOR|nr:uncharacterized protein EI97DRAFT_489156 [Westerdykella ornata]KAF2277602.1 hypothetical protein EI97DRAFT_489156 [Westerdykella ornata]
MLCDEGKVGINKPVLLLTNLNESPSLEPAPKPETYPPENTIAEPNRSSLSPVPVATKPSDTDSPEKPNEHRSHESREPVLEASTQESRTIAPVQLLTSPEVEPSIQPGDQGPKGSHQESQTEAPVQLPTTCPRVQTV